MHSEKSLTKDLFVEKNQERHLNSIRVLLKSYGYLHLGIHHQQE